MAGGRSPRRGRLSRSAEFDRVLRSGRSRAGPELVLYVFPRGGDEAARLGLSVSRKVGGAVQRNLVKRLLRDAFDAEHDRLPAGTDAVVIARRGASELAARSGLAGIRAALAALVDKVPGAESAPAEESSPGGDPAGGACDASGGNGVAGDGPAAAGGDPGAVDGRFEELVS